MTGRSAALVFAMVCIAPAGAAAQQSERFTAGGTLGLARTWDDESLLGTGMTAEGRLGMNITRKMQLEIGSAYIPFERHFESGVSTEGHSVFTALMLKYDFTGGGFRPFAMVGYGLNRFDGTRRHPTGEARTSSNDFGYVAGAGFVVRKGRWDVGPEARVHMFAIDQDSSAAMMLSGGIRANYRF